MYYGHCDEVQVLNPYLLASQEAVSSRFGIWRGDRRGLFCHLLDDEGSESMIRVCTCTRGSAFPHENLRHPEGSKTCKNCGGKPSVDGRGALSVSMLSSVGLELSGVTDPHLNWKAARQRPIRRARTSFTQGNKKRSTVKNSKESEDLTHKDSKRTGDMHFSESEKLGVSILGRHFSDALESVPIKKRRFMLVRSPSPPPQSSSHSDDSDLVRGGQSASYEEDTTRTKQHALDIKPGIGMELIQERFFADERTNLEDLNEKLRNSADFSGISILAAAACDSNVGGDVLNAEGSVFNEHSSREQVYRHTGSEDKDEKIDKKENLDGKTTILPEVPNTLLFPDKELDGTKLEGPHLYSSTSYLQNVPNKISKVKSFSRDDRLHWDLNIVMDVWESHSDEILNSEPLAANSNVEDGTRDEKVQNLELHRSQMGFGETECASEVVDSRNLGGVREDNFALEETKLHEKPDISKDNSDADHNVGKNCLSLLHGGGSVQEEHELEVASVAVTDTAEETEPLHNQETSSFITGVVSSLVGGALVSARDSSFVAATFEGEKDDGRCVGIASIVENEVSSSSLVPCENANSDHLPAYKPHEGMDQITEVVAEENTFAASVGDVDHHSANCCPTEVKMGQASHSRRPLVEKHAPLHIDSGNDKTDRCLESHQLAEEPSAVIVDGIVCKDMMNTTGVSCETAHTNALDEADCACYDKFKEASISSFPSESHAFNSQELSNNADLSSGNACAGKHETTDADMKMQDAKCFVPTDETLNSNRTDYHIPTDPGVPVCSSPLMKPGAVGVPPIDGALNSHGVCKSYIEGYGSSPGRVASEDHFDSDYNSDASQIDTDQPTGMEKIDFMRDDDYQYEDGEFRESVANSWGFDGSEEGENEHVDYGSENIETDIMETASDFPVCVPVHVDSVEGKNGWMSDANPDHKFCAQVGKETEVAISQPLPKCSSLTDVLNTESAKGGIKDGSKKLEWNAKDASESGTVCDKIIGDRVFLNEGDASRESSHLASFRMKSSGWDRLPEGCGGSGGRMMFSVSRNHADASLDEPNIGESSRRVAGSSLRRDLFSVVERPKSSDLTQRKFKSYERENRSNDHRDLDSRVERGTGSPRSIERGGASLRMHGQGRRDRWVDSQRHCGPTHHDSRGYYGPARFTSPSSRNAAAATVAKLESNGFVVAPDGTIVKAGGVEPPARVPRSTQASSNCQHRSGGCDPGMVSTAQRERYHVPIRAIPSDSRDTISSPHHPLSRSEQSFSRQRRPLHPSCTRSPSRSRTRSPHMRPSPRGRNDRGMNGDLGIRLRSRSPNFKSDVKIQRLRSPHCRSGMVEHMVDYAPLSRNHTSPPHASRWVDERKDLPDHFGEHKRNQFSGRSPPGRVFSRNHRLDPMESLGRAKSKEHCLPIHSGKFPGYVGFDKGPRSDGCIDDRRGYWNRHEMLHSVKQFDHNRNMNRFRYDVEEGFGAHNAQPRSSEFQQRLSPRGFNRGIENQPGDSPRRAKEEKVHGRYDKDGKHDAAFKPFGVRECEDDMTPRRRKPS